MILEFKHKNFKGTLQIKGGNLKNLISGTVCPYQGLLNNIT
jgi:hypothetical protein